MGLFEKIKKGMELKQNSPNHDSIQNTHKKILKLEKKLETNPDNSRLLIDLYGCYVETFDTVKKIECMEKLSHLRPNDLYPLQQLAYIYSNDVGDVEQAKYYQNKANKIKKFL